MPKSFSSNYGKIDYSSLDYSNISLQDNLLLTSTMYLAFSKHQNQKTARRNYRITTGKNNQISLKPTRVSAKDIEARFSSRREKLRPKLKLIDDESSVQSFPELKRIAKKDLKKYFDEARLSAKNIENIDFSGMDLSDVNLDNLCFVNSNFREVRFPSMNNTKFYNPCNLEYSDWRDTTQCNLEIGSPVYQKQIIALSDLISQNQILVHNISDFDDLQTVQLQREKIAKKTSLQVYDELVKLTPKTNQKPLVISARGANFARVDFKSFFGYYTDFSQANFDGAVFRIYQGVRSRDKTFYVPTISSIDLSKATFQFIDNQEVIFAQTTGSKPLDLSSIEPNLRILVGNSGIVSQEYCDLMRSKKQIVIKVNANPKKIPVGLKFQSISKVNTSTKLTTSKVHEFEERIAELGNQFYGRYNFKFVVNEESEKSDFKIHFNLVDGIGSALASEFNCFGLGMKEGFIAMDEVELGRDFDSILSHELAHLMMFMHPFDRFAIDYPSQTSYISPMATTINQQNQLMASNQILIGSLTPIDQRVLEKYMAIFDRKALITEDLFSHLTEDSFGVLTSYNPSDFANIVEIDPKVFEGQYKVVIMNANQALNYCKSLNLYRCQLALGMDQSNAVMLMAKDTGIVKAMVILTGKNPRIKIQDEKLLALDELYFDQGFTIIEGNKEGALAFKKFAKIDDGFKLKQKLHLKQQQSYFKKLLMTTTEDHQQDFLISSIKRILGINIVLLASGVLYYLNRSRVKSRTTPTSVNLASKSKISKSLVD